MSKQYVDSSAIDHLTPHETTIAIGTGAMEGSGGTHITALGYQALKSVTNNNPGQNVAVGSKAANFFQMNSSVCIGYNAGGQSGSRNGDNNVMIGNQAGYKAWGSRNLFLGSGVMYNGGSGNDRFVLGRSTNHLFVGKIPLAGVHEGELFINATKLSVPSTIKTQADLSSLSIGDIYCDTSAGNTLKVKL